MLAQPCPGLSRSEPRSIESDRLQLHRLIGADAVDEVHAGTAGAVVPAEPVELVRVHQARCVLTGIRTAAVPQAAVLRGLDALGPGVGPALPGIAAPRCPGHATR